MECAYNSLILKKIFNHLCLSELMKMRLVCKDWKSRIDRIILNKDELIFFINTDIQPLCWFFEKRPIDFRNVAIVKNDFYENRFLRNWFKTVKHLLILSYSKIKNNRFLTKFINDFYELEHLQLEFYLPPKKFFCFNRELQSDKLQTFYSSKSVSLNNLICEKLVKLSFFNKFDFRDTLETIQNKIQFLSLSVIEYDQSLVFPNLETLILNQTILHNFCVEFERSNFPKLKQLLYFGDCSNFLKNCDTSATELMDVLNEKPKVDFFVNGLKLNDRLKRKLHCCAKKLDLGLNEFLKLYKENEIEMNLELYANDVIYYTDELGKIIQKCNEELFDTKFETNIHRLYIKEPFYNFKRFGNSKNFFQFIHSIHIQHNLNQDQLDTLPEAVPYVKTIEFSGYSIDENINYQFLSKFNKLQFLLLFLENNFTVLLNLKEFIDDFKNLERIEIGYCNFASSKFRIFIKKKENNTYLVNDGSYKELYYSYAQFLEFSRNKFGL